MSNQQDGTNPSPSASSAEAKAPELVPATLDNVLEAAGVDLKNPEVSRALEISMSFMVARGSLPLPPPELLAQYEKEFPGLGRKLIEWTEQQRDHRQQLERNQVEGAEKRMNRGQLIAAAVALVGLGLRDLLAYLEARGRPVLSRSLLLEDRRQRYGWPAR